MAINKKDFKKAIRLPYELISGDVDTGVTSYDKLIELSLELFIEKFEDKK